MDFAEMGLELSQSLLGNNNFLFQKMNVPITGEVWLYTLMLVALPMVATAIYFVDTDPIQVIFRIY